MGDTSVSIVRSSPKELQASTVERVDGHAKGCRITHKSVRGTRYVVKNNTDRTVQKFYIDHSASTDHGGYVISTSKSRVKSVTGFSRYEVALGPFEEVTVEVTEE